MNCGNSELFAVESENISPHFDLDQAIYVAMPDGVKLAADVYLPQK